jgi:toxin ParE1/3/4
MGSIRFTSTAENDLLEAWLYVAEDNIVAADDMVDQIQSAAESLLSQPHMGRLRSELAAGLQSWPTSTPYVLYYFPGSMGMIVARVLHHARDIPAI